MLSKYVLSKNEVVNYSLFEIAEKGLLCFNTNKNVKKLAFYLKKLYIGYYKGSLFLRKYHIDI